MSALGLLLGLLFVGATFAAVNRTALERDELRELEVVGAWMS